VGADATTTTRGTLSVAAASAFVFLDHNFFFRVAPKLLARLLQFFRLFTDLFLIFSLSRDMGTLGNLLISNRNELLLLNRRFLINAILGEYYLIGRAEVFDVG
jgi:hypothetical protein